MATASRLVGRYQIGHLLGTGTVGDVYAGRDVVLDRPVAVKVLRDDLATDRAFLRRYVREVKAAARLSHPNIVAVFDILEQDGRHYVVTELVEGHTLAELLAKASAGGGLPVAEPARLIGQACAALSAAHARGLLHSDLHPGNILVTDDGRVKVADFGSGAAGRGAPALSSSLAGDLRAAVYAAPEEALGEPLDARSDLYSLAVCLYECLDGSPPFSGQSPADVTAAHASQPPPPLRAERPELPASLDAVMARALAKDPERRYQRAADLREDLDLALAGRPLRHAGAPESAHRAEPKAAPLAAPVAKLAEPAKPVRDPLPLAAERPLELAAVAAPSEPLAAGRVPTAPIDLDPVLDPALDPVADQAPATDPVWDFVFEPEVAFGDDDRPPSTIDPDGHGTRQRHRGRTATMILALPLLLVVLVGLALQQAGVGPFPGKSHRAPTLTVPSLSWVAAADARDTLAQLGLGVQERTQPHGVIPVDHVITTDPPAGTPVRRGETVTLVVSSGPTTAPVPSLLDQQGAQAQAALVGEGYPTEVREVVSDAPAGTVLAQDPPAGQRLKPGRKLVLTVAKPPPVAGSGGGTVTPIPTATTQAPAPATTLPTATTTAGGRDPGPGPDNGPPGGGGPPPTTEPATTTPPDTDPPTTTPPTTEPPTTEPPTTTVDNGRGGTVPDAVGGGVDVSVTTLLG